MRSLALRMALARRFEFFDPQIDRIHFALYAIFCGQYCRLHLELTRAGLLRGCPIYKALAHPSRPIGGSPLVAYVVLGLFPVRPGPGLSFRLGRFSN